MCPGRDLECALGGRFTITGHQGGAVPEYHEREVAREIDAATGWREELRVQER